MYCCNPILLYALFHLAQLIHASPSGKNFNWLKKSDHHDHCIDFLAETSLRL